MDLEDIEFLINAEEAGERLDLVLAKRFKDLGSRTFFQTLIASEHVSVNDQPIIKRFKPKAGDKIEIEFPLQQQQDLKPENIPLEIVYEDEGLLVINKAAGMVVHPAPGNWSGTFVNALLYHCNGRTFSEENSLRPGIVHRLDKETSGLLIAAKNPFIQQKLIEMFSQRKVFKEYLALCIGNPKAGSIDLPIGRHPFLRKQMAVVEKGRSALTHFKTLAFSDAISLVSVVIDTGRTHQIRVHMRHHGTPILGDQTYGMARVNHQLKAERQMLHARKLKFIHPLTEKTMEFEASIPTDFSSYLEKFCLYGTKTFEW